jgi:hypothetical protein
MTWRNLPIAGATLLCIFGCSSSKSDDGAGGATTAAGRDSGAPTTGAGASSVGGTNSAGATAGSSSTSAGGGSTTAGSGGVTSGGAGSSGGGGDLPPVDPTADARKLSDGDKAVLCDWMNEKLGGYGLMTECSPSFSVMNLPNQAVCIASFFNFDCNVTVQEVETCTIARAPSHACDGDPVGCHHLFCQP